MKLCFPTAFIQVSSLIFVPLFLGKSNSASSQITPDNTLGNESSVVNSRDETSDRIDGGALRGQNLFHSFEEFNIGEGRGVYFTNPNTVSNIFSRVTGNNPSNILGTLGVDGAADLYLVNPNGIVFGENSSLDVRGSFTATTADAIEFSEGGLFSAIAPGESLLTISVPLGLQFGSSPASITNRSFVQDETGENVGLQVPSGKNLALIGGDINFERGQATALGGRIELGGLSTTGTISLIENIGFSFPETFERADISLSDRALVNVRAGGGGFIKVNGRNVTLSEQSELLAGIAENMGSPNVQAGDITIDATESVRLVGQNRQNIIVDSVRPNQPDPRRIASITERENATGIRNNVGLSAVRRNDGTTPSSAIGNGGNIEINTPILELDNLSVINAGVFGQGDGGNININANEIVSKQGIFSTEVIGEFGFDLDGIQEGGSGDAGDISINAESLSLTDATLIFANIRSEAPGNAGDVNIWVSDTFVQNTDSFILTQLGPNNSMGSADDIDISAGDINIRAGFYEIGEQGTLSQEGSFPALQSDVSTGSTGDAGNITIDVEDNFSITGNLILTQVQAGAVGNGGDINIAAGAFNASNGSLILADTRGLGNAGNVSIAAGSLEVSSSQILANLQFLEDSENANIAGNINIDVEETIFIDKGSLIQTELGESTEGNAGDIVIAGNALIIENGSNIIARTKGQGDAGNITITTNGAIDAISLDNNAKITSTVDGGAIGDGGSIFLETGELNLTDDSEIVADTAGQGNAGNIDIDVIGGDINLNNSTQIQSQTRGSAEESDANAGNITIETDGSLFSINGNLILADSQAEGNGGSITIIAGEQILLEGRSDDGEPSQIVVGLSNENAKGTGGIIEIEAGELVLDDEAFITSRTRGQGDAGDITIMTNGAIDAISLDNSAKITSTVDGGAIGDGGSIFLETGELNLTDDSEIVADTAGQGNAGNIDIDVIGGDINLNNSTQIQSQTRGSAEESNANAGNITIETNGSLFSTNGNFILADSKAKGNGGNITIIAEEQILLEGRSDDGEPSQIVAGLSNENAKGKGGNIIVEAGELVLDDVAFIASNTVSGSIGGAGSVTIDVDNLRLSENSLINAFTANDEDGGEIMIDAQTLNLASGGKILAATDGGGDAGNINLYVSDRITVDNSIKSSAEFVYFGEGSLLNDLQGSPSGIYADANENATGSGGNISIFSSNSLFLNGNATISTSIKSEQGNINFISTDLSQSSGGNITISVGEIRLRGDSDITTDIASGEGSGGNITLTADSIIAFDDSDIFAFAADGQGGNIKLNTPAFFAENFTLNSLTADPNELDFNNRADVNATGAVSGSVSIPDVSFIQNSLNELSNSSIDTNELVANSCVVPAGERNQGKFIITGGESLPVRPGGNLPSKYPTGEVRGASENNSSWQTGDPIVEAQDAYRLANGEWVLSRECPNSP